MDLVLQSTSNFKFQYGKDANANTVSSMEVTGPSTLHPFVMGMHQNLCWKLTYFNGIYISVPLHILILKLYIELCQDLSFVHLSKLNPSFLLLLIKLLAFTKEVAVGFHLEFTEDFIWFCTVGVFAQCRAF